MVKEVEEGMLYPFVGTLVSFILTDAEGKAVFTGSQVNHDYTISLRPVTSADGKHVFPGDAWTLRSPAFTTTLLAYLQRQNPDLLEERRKFYREAGMDFDRLIHNTEEREM